MSSRLIEIADQVRALASTGLHYTEGEFDRERYHKLLRLAAEIASAQSGVPAASLEQLYRGADRGYVTPKLDVRMAVFERDHVLLVRERSDGRWSLPGGYVDVGDSPSEAAVRETEEEACVTVRVRRLAGVFDTRLQPDCPPHLFHIHKLVFIGERTDPRAQPRGSAETLEAVFQPVDALPELSMGRTLPLHIREARRVASDPAALPYFD